MPIYSEGCISITCQEGETSRSSFVSPTVNHLQDENLVQFINLIIINIKFYNIIIWTIYYYFISCFKSVVLNNFLHTTYTGAEKEQKTAVCN
jgi:hypothetical protein